MYCPQCGTESGSEQRYCRSCGSNLKVIAKAVTLGEAISKTDGVPAKIKEIISNIKIAHVTDEVARAMDKMNTEIARTSTDHREWTLRKDREEYRHELRRRRREKTAEQRRERHLVKGIIKLFWGGGLTTFLYFLAHSMVLKLPYDVIAKVPFEIDPVVRVIWLIGLIPMLSGLGHLLAGLMIRPDKVKVPEFEPAPMRIEAEANAGAPLPQRSFDDERTIASPIPQAPASVTDRTTNILDHVARQQANSAK